MSGQRSTSDARDTANMRQFMTRASGMNTHAPAARRSPGNAFCDCAIDQTTGRSYCVCSAMITSDIAFAPDGVAGISTRPHIRFASACERAALKRRQAFLATSIA